MTASTLVPDTGSGRIMMPQLKPTFLRSKIIKAFLSLYQIQHQLHFKALGQEQIGSPGALQKLLHPTTSPAVSPANLPHMMPTKMPFTDSPEAFLELSKHVAAAGEWSEGLRYLFNYLLYKGPSFMWILQQVDRKHFAS